MASSSSSRRSDRIAARGDRRRLPRAARQVGQEAPQLIQRVVLVGRLVVDRAGARLGAGAAERLLVGRLAHGRGDDRRPGDEELGAAAHDDAEVAEDDARGAEPGARPERGGDDRHAREVLDHQVEARQRRDVGEAHRLERLDAAPAARAVDQAHERDAQLVGGALGPHHLLPDGGVGRPAADGEVVGLDHRAAPVDAALADDRVGRQEARQLARVVVLALARERAGLVEAAGIEQALHALAHGELAGGVLARDALGAAHLARELLAAAQLVELGLPRHRHAVCRTTGRWDHQAMTVGRSAAAALVALSVAVASGCGGAKQRSTPSPQPVANDLAPRRRPRMTSRCRPACPTARPGRRRSRRAASSTTGSRRCAAATSRRAAHYFALPSKFQNATPVLTVNTEQERIAVNMSLSCGAVATAMGGAGAYTIVKFRLTKRPGGVCGTRRGRDGARRDPRRAAHDQGVVPPARPAARRAGAS